MHRAPQRDVAFAKRVASVRALAVICVAIVATALGAGCKKDDGGAAGPTVEISGVVQKGLFTTLQVNAFPLDPVTAVKAQPIPAVVDGQTFTVKVPQDVPILIEVEGVFLDDLSGTPVELDEPLLVGLPLGDPTSPANVNVATTLAALNALTQIEASGLLAAEQFEQSNDLLVEALAMPPGTKLNALDFNEIDASSTLTDPNLQLLLLSGTVSNSLSSGDLFAGGLGPVADAIAAADQLAGLMAPLAVFQGAPAGPIYDAIQASGNAGTLPLLDLLDNAIWTCEDGCGWLPQPSPTISVSSAFVWEAHGVASVRVYLGQAAFSPIDVNVTTKPGTAFALFDYEPVVTTVTVGAGEFEAFVEIPIPIDAHVEQDETFEVEIEYEGGGWVVANAAATVTILDGAPPAVTDAAATLLSINKLCLNGIGRPGEVVDSDCAGRIPLSVPFSVGEGYAAAVEIDLEAACTLADDPCPPEDRHWLVHYVLVARDGGDVFQRETPLGDYVYLKDSVHRTPETATPRSVQIGLHSANAIVLMDEAALNDWGLEIEARIGLPPDQLVKQLNLPTVLAVPGVLIADDITVNVEDVHAAAYGGACAADELDVTADFGFSLGSTVEARVCVAPGQSTDGKYNGTLTSGTIDLDFLFIGLSYDYVGISENAEGSSNPFGVPYVAVVPPIGPDGQPTTSSSFLHKEGWPFLFKISGGSVTPDGMTLEYSGMRYVHSFGYSVEDARRDGNVHSNDAFYREVAASGVLDVDGNGEVSTSFLVAGGSGHTSFPKADVTWASFPHTLTAGAIVDRPGLSITDFSLDQEASCRDAECLDRSARTTSVASDVASIDPRGFVVASATTLGAAPAGWGARAGGDVAWSRPDDWNSAGDPAALAIPGYRLSRNTDVSKQLLAHLEEGDDEHIVHPLGTVENADGNHYPTGVSFGPKIYRDGSGVPDMTAGGQDPTGNVLRIDNGSDTLNLPTSVAAKYVVRNGGVTGVFNVDSSALASPATLYGYNLELTRFAVRTVDNQLDPFNWVDGALTVHGDLGGPSGFGLHFTNLQLNCAARLGRANLAYERCDERDDDGNGVIDENCDHRLWAWSADAETFSMAFGEGGVCDDAPQQLVLDQQVDFEALDRPMGVQGSWDSGGTLTSQHTQLANAYRLDERDGDDDAVGFPIRPKAGALAAADVAGLARGRYGWLEMAETLVGVPFWDALNSDVRVANRESIGQTVAEPTVMTGAGDLGALAANQVNTDLQQDFIDNGPPVEAHYGWGNTGFGFTLPVYYSPWQFNREQSKFLGIRQEIDLFVLEAGAGIDFIEPDRTKLSFGASADFAKLKGVRFQIDLEDPKSLRAVDDLLVSLRIVDSPVVEPALSGLQSEVQVLNKYANKGLDEAMQAGLELALEELGEAAADITPGGKDPFVTVSEAMAQIKSYPTQVITILDDEVRGPIDAALTRHEADLRNELQALESQVTALEFGEPVPQSAFDALAAVRGRLGVITESVTAVNAVIGTPIAEADRVLLAAKGPVSQLEDASLVVDQLLLQAVSFSKTACESKDIANGEGSGYLEDAVARVASVRNIFALLQSDELLLPLTELLDHDPELRERIQKTQRDMEAKTEELTGFLDEAETALNDKICDPQVFDVLLEARALMSQITTGARSIDGFLSTAHTQVAQLAQVRDTLLSSVVTPMVQLDVALASMQATLEAESEDFRGTDGAFFMDEMDTLLAQTSGYTLTAVVLDDGQTGTDVLSLAFGLGNRLVHNELDAVRDDLIASVDDLLPGAFFTPEELRRMIVTAIMASPPVNDLRAEMETHLAEINKRVNDLVLQLLDQLNLGVKGALAGAESAVNEALEDALAPVRNIPLESASIDGFAVIAGNELERAHIGAEWTMSPAADGEEPNSFGASLDAVSWSASGKAAGCGTGDADGRLDVSISALGLPAKVAGSEIVLKKVYLGFNLLNNPGGPPPLTVRGVFGGLSVTGDIKFAEAIVYDPAFAAGIGDVETYLGASAGALFSDIQAEVAFLAGRTCNHDVLLDLDAKVATFIDLPDTGFAGVYLRGAASIPLLTLGCPLTVGVGAEFGSWVLAGPPLTLGGLVGGAAYGKVACVGAIRGQIRALGQVNTDGDWSFAGEGFGAAGVGWCEPSSWTTRARSRDDDWCATGDAFFNASFDGSWNIPAPELGAVY